MNRRNFLSVAALAPVAGAVALAASDEPTVAKPTVRGISARGVIISDVEGRARIEKNWVYDIRTDSMVKLP